MNEAGVKLHIRVCMGSSCFARGNRKNLVVIREYLQKHAAASVRVELEGCLCEGRCSDGPHIRINGRLFDCVKMECVEKILEQYLLDER